MQVNFYVNNGCGCGGNSNGSALSNGNTGFGGNSDSLEISDQAVSSIPTSCDVATTVIPYIANQVHEFLDAIKDMTDFSASTIENVVDAVDGFLDAPSSIIDFIKDLSSVQFDNTLDMFSDTDFIREWQQAAVEYLPDRVQQLSRDDLRGIARLLPKAFGGFWSGNQVFFVRTQTQELMRFINMDKVNRQVRFSLDDADPQVCDYLRSNAGKPPIIGASSQLPAAALPTGLSGEIVTENALYRLWRFEGNEVMQAVGDNLTLSGVDGLSMAGILVKYEQTGPATGIGIVNLTVNTDYGTFAAGTNQSSLNDVKGRGNWTTDAKSFMDVNISYDDLTPQSVSKFGSATDFPTTVTGDISMQVTVNEAAQNLQITVREIFVVEQL